jgi:hypothetical protein
MHIERNSKECSDTEVFHTAAGKDLRKDAEFGQFYLSSNAHGFAAVARPLPVRPQEKSPRVHQPTRLSVGACAQGDFRYA